MIIIILINNKYGENYNSYKPIYIAEWCCTFYLFTDGVIGLVIEQWNTETQL